MGCFFSCFDGGNKEQRKEQDRLASAEARAKAAEAAQKRSLSLPVYDSLLLLFGVVKDEHSSGLMSTRVKNDKRVLQEQFEQSAAGRAARAQVQAAAKQSASSNKGEPVLKGKIGSFTSSYCGMVFSMMMPLSSNFMPCCLL
ncbi:hypothetical protein Gotur_014818 [Gossypium turneri]